MSTVENGMVSGLPRHYAAEGRREAADSAAFQYLRNDLIDALMSNPDAEIRTPGSVAGGTSPAWMIFYDRMTSGKRGDEILRDAIKVIGMAASGKSGPELRLTASALIAGVAAEFADFHSGDLADEMGDD